MIVKTGIAEDHILFVVDVFNGDLDNIVSSASFETFDEFYRYITEEKFEDTEGLNCCLTICTGDGISMSTAFENSYNFKDGKGTATISQKNGVKCTGNVNGGLTGGALTIQGNSIANCTDGSSYAMPKVVCKPGKDGNSDCTSSYDGKSSGTTKSEFPMTLHR